MILNGFILFQGFTQISENILNFKIKIFKPASNKGHLN